MEEHEPTPFEQQREEAILTLDEDLDKFVLISESGGDIKTIFAARGNENGTTDHLGLLLQSTRHLFQVTEEERS